MKTGRNEKCPCGSQKKFKHCCLPKRQAIPEHVIQHARQEFKKHNLKQKIRDQRFGKVRPIIHADFQGHKFIAVGNQLHASKSWKTMTDFLYDYLKIAFGKEWWLEEAKKAEEERHSTLRWARAMYEHQEKNRQQDQGSEIYSIQPNGPMQAYLTLAYDLYVLKDNQKLQDKLLKRLRHNDQFIGARYELYVAATFVRAGYDVVFEDESDGNTKHPEFIATHKTTGQVFAVEAKKRRRTKNPTPEELNTENVKLGVVSLIRKALAKNNGQNFIVFVDLGLPTVEGNIFEKPWTKQLLESPTEAGARDSDGKDNFNLLVFTNYPVEPINEKFPAHSYVAVVPLSPKVPLQHGNAINEIMKSVEQFGRTPSHFEE